MGVQFDPINKYILITSPTTQIASLEIYNATMDWCDDQETISYTVPMQAVGKFGMGGGVYSDSIFIMLGGWKIKPWSGDYQLVITGTIITDDETPRTVLPDSGNVEVIFQVSSQATVIPDEAEWTQTEKNELKSDIDEINSDVNGIVSDIGNVSSDVNAIKTKSELLPSDPASESGVKTHVTEKIGDVQTLANKINLSVDECLSMLGDQSDLITNHLLHELQKIKDAVESYTPSMAPETPKSVAAWKERQLNP